MHITYDHNINRALLWLTRLSFALFRSIIQQAEALFWSINICMLVTVQWKFSNSRNDTLERKSFTFPCSTAMPNSSRKFEGFIRLWLGYLFRPMSVDTYVLYILFSIIYSWTLCSFHLRVRLKKVTPFTRNTKLVVLSSRELSVYQQ